MEHSTTDQYPSSKCISEAHEAFYKTILKRFKWSTKSNSIRSYLKDLSEAHEVFYKSMNGYLMLAWFLKKRKNTKDTNHVNKTKTEVCRYLLKKKDGMPTGASPRLDAWVYFEIFTWGALGIPKLELLPLFILLLLIAPRPSDTSSTQNFNKNFVRPVSVIKQTTTLSNCNELIIYLYWC